MWIECLIGNEENVHDIALIPQSVNFDPILVILTTNNLYFFSDADDTGKSLINSPTTQSQIKEKKKEL